MDCRLKTIPFEFDGNRLELAVNMNVLADVQEMNNGDFSLALRRGSVIRSLIQFLTAAINDAADVQGLDKRYTVRQVGRMISPEAFTAVRAPLMDAVKAAFQPEDTEGSTEKKQETTQAQAAE